MPARRSDDPAATAQSHDPAAAIEHWTPSRRHAATPARRERDAPESSASEAEAGATENDTNSDDEGPNCSGTSG